MPYLFRPPTVSYRIDNGERLWSYFGQDKGISVIKDYAGYHAQEYPTTDQFDAAIFVFVGGHEYIVSDVEANLLAQAGFGDLTPVADEPPIDTGPPVDPTPPDGGGETPPDTDPDEYGLGPYGTGVYGE